MPFPNKVGFNYHPQTKFVKVMFLQVSVCPQGEGHAWLPGGMHGYWRVACVVAGGVCMVDRGCAWLWGVCMFVGGMGGW